MNASRDFVISAVVVVLLTILSYVLVDEVTDNDRLALIVAVVVLLIGVLGAYGRSR